VTTGTPSSNELQQISTGQKVVLLLRITLDVDGKRSDPFSSSSPDGNVNLAYLGSTINKRIETYRFPSEEAREAGWIYLIENPGTYYMAVQPPRGSENAFSFHFKFRSAPRWRIDALAGAGLVYIGSLHIDAYTRPGLLFGHQVVYDPTKMNVREEKILAGDVAKKYFPEFGRPVTLLMERLPVPTSVATPD
jgi:hypothetical protein